MSDDEKAAGESQPPHAHEDLPRVVAARDLFDGEREICIEHGGELYRLRITRRNKLILQK